MFKFSQRGVSALFALLIMTLILGISLGISTILLQQLKMIREIGNSVIAFYAAETGIEEILVSKENPSSSCIKDSPCELNNGATYYLIINPAGPACSSTNYCLKSIGIFKKTRRGIEVNY